MGIPIRTSTEQKNIWKTQDKVRTEMKKMVFNFGKAISQSIARKLARKGMTYKDLEDLYLKSHSKEEFSKSMDVVVKTTKNTKEKINGHFLQLSKKKTTH